MRPHPRSKRRYWRDRKRQETRLKKREAALNFFSRAIFSLFPATTLKNLPVFPEAITNTGIIWANIAKPMPMPPNDWMCGFYPGFRSFSPSQGMGRIIENPAPPRSYMREMFLERECMTIFPLADAGSRAAYVAHSIEMAEKGPTERSLYTRQTMLFNEILTRAAEVMTMNPTIRIEDAETGVIYYPANFYGMRRIWAAHINEYVYTNYKKSDEATPPEQKETAPGPPAE